MTHGQFSVRCSGQTFQKISFVINTDTYCASEQFKRILRRLDFSVNTYIGDRLHGVKSLALPNGDVSLQVTFEQLEDGFTEVCICWQGGLLNQMFANILRNEAESKKLQLAF